MKELDQDILVNKKHSRISQRNIKFLGQLPKKYTCFSNTEPDVFLKR